MEAKAVSAAGATVRGKRGIGTEAAILEVLRHLRRSVDLVLLTVGTLVGYLLRGNI